MNENSFFTELRKKVLLFYKNQGNFAKSGELLFCKEFAGPNTQNNLQTNFPSLKRIDQRKIENNKKT